MKTIIIVGAGPGGLATAKALLDEGLEPLVLEGSDAIGGQWNSKEAHSGIWQGMCTNTSKATTVFSDLAHEEGLPMFPSAESIGAYLVRYAAEFGLADRVRTGARVECIARKQDGGYVVTYRDGEGEHALDAAAVVVASGRCNRPKMPEDIEGLATFSGRGGLHHAFDYQGRDAFAGMRVLTIGNSISGLEIAAELAKDASIDVVSTCRKARYIIQKHKDGVPSDWRFFNRAALFAGRTLPPEVSSAGLRDQVLALHGNPADYGAPTPSEDMMQAGLGQCQDYLALCADGRIATRGVPVRIDGSDVTFEDGTTERFDAIIAGTGYQLNLPYLDDALAQTLNADDDEVDLYNYTFNPNVPDMAFVGQFVLVGPYFPVLELQARWIAMVFAGSRPLPAANEMDDNVRTYRMMRGLNAPLLCHEVAIDLATAAGVEPDPQAFPELAAGLVFGPIVPAQFRLSGHGRHEGAVAKLRTALKAAGATATPPIADEQLGLLAMLTKQPKPWPGVAGAYAAVTATPAAVAPRAVPGSS
jgi:cation diffusion facilitator CzcD-associated flavoprotein CzcO